MAFVFPKSNPIEYLRKLEGNKWVGEAECARHKRERERPLPKLEKIFP